MCIRYSSKFKALPLTALFIVAAIFSMAGCTQKSEETYKIGYMNCNSEKETQARFGPLTAYLSRELGVNFEAVPVDTQDFEERFNAGDFQFTHSNSLVYIILKETKNLQLLATEKRGQYGSRTAGAIIARRDSGIKTLEDIKGKRMIFGPQLAPSGFLAQYDYLLQNGINPEIDIPYYRIPSGSFKHEKVVYGVYFKEFDVGAAPALDLELMAADGKIEPDDFIILGQSQIIPYCTFGAGADVDQNLSEKFQKALLDLTTETKVEFGGEEVKVLNSAWIDGFEQLIDSDYNPIREMAKRANMPPYQEF